MIDRVRFEAESRAVRTTKLEVVDNKLGKTFDVPGSLIVFVGPMGSPTLKLARAAMGGDEASYSKYQAAFKKQAAGRKSLALTSAVEATIAAPVFADLRYAGSTLNSGIFLPKGLDIGMIVLPYNGGRLAAGSFSLIEYAKEGRKEALEAFVVRSNPPLTKGERAALAAVPTDQLVRNVGSAMDCETTYWAVAFVVAAVVVTVTVACAMPLPDLHISERELASLPPAASARRLVQIRRAALQARLNVR